MMDFLRRLFGARGRPTGPSVHVDDLPASPGWDAINAAADRAHPGREPQHWGTIISWRLGGPDPLDGVSAYLVEEPPHWHYVTLGLSELFEKESVDPAVSGWGFELTFRLAREPDDTAAPIWAVNLLQNLAKHVVTSGVVFAPGHHIDAHGPIALGEETDVRALLCVEDPELGTIATPNGRVHFVQLVGITVDEYSAAQDWSSDPIADVLRRGNPLLVTDLRRTSVRLDPTVDEEIRAGIERDGSRMDGISVDVLEVEESDQGLTIRLGAIGMEGLERLLRGRARHGRDLSILGPTFRLEMQPGPELSWHRSEEGDIHVDLPAVLVDAILETPRVSAGTHVIGSGQLVLKVEQTVIRDLNGNEIERIG